MSEKNNYAFWEQRERKGLLLEVENPNKGILSEVEKVDQTALDNYFGNTESQNPWNDIWFNISWNNAFVLPEKSNQELHEDEQIVSLPSFGA